MISAASSWKSRIAWIRRESQKVAAWRLPFALFACALIAYGAALAWHMLNNFDLVSLIGDGNGDDAFYYFQIAYNLSQGKFSTFDGGITQTNGYQPVWLMLITPFYWLFDKETALFAIKALEIMLVAGGVAVIALATRVARLAWPLLFAALPTLYRYPDELLWGMEAAAAMFTLSLLVLAVCLYMRSPDRWKWHVAAIAFALPWVRIEYIAISLAVTAALCVIEWSRQERRSLRLSELANIRRAYIPLIGAIAGIMVYFAYNGLVFGGILPVSAATKLAWSQAKWAQQGGYSFIENFRGALQFNAFDYELLIAFEICVYLLIAWRLALRSNDRRDWLLLAFMVGMFGLATGHIAKFAQTALIMHPFHGDKIWYFVPAYLMTALIIPVRLYVAIHLIRRFVAPRRRIAANALSAGVVVIGAALLLGSAGFAEPFRWIDQKSKSTLTDEWEITSYWHIASYMGAQVMNRSLPEGSIIGSWDAGVIGYFSRLPVVNLDGLVNSYDYLSARSIRQTEGLDFYRRYGVTHFANNRRRDQIPNNVMFEGAPFDGWHGVEHHFTLWTYDPEPGAPVEIDYSQQIWERMEPRFDYSSDGVGVVLAGRAAQAFAKDCLPDNPMVWTWSDQKYERTVSLEINPYRSRANMCVDARVLPRDADQSAHAKMTPLSAYFANLASSSDPIIRGDFDVYLIDSALIYTKSQCSQEDVKPRFFAKISPVDTDNLPDSIRQRGYETIDFKFSDYGAIADDGRCWADAKLPDYPIAQIRAGQYATVADGYRYLWEDAYQVSDEDSGADVDFEILASIEPIIRSNFDVYLLDNRLIYTKSQCSQEDVTATFYASVFPVDWNDLPYRHRLRGYGGADFNFDDYGAINDDRRCWAAVDLPNYPIAEIHTGQYVESADGYTHIWEGAYTFGAAARRIGAKADFAMLADRAPIIRSDFDVYLLGDRLIYTKSQCSQDEVVARFFVSIFPLYAESLPDDSLQYGYEAVEFNFGDYGAIAADGNCWAAVDLPKYPIAEIHSGQYVTTADGYDYLWEGAYRFE